MAAPLAVRAPCLFNDIGGCSGRPKKRTFSDTASSGVTSACDHFLHVSSTYPMLGCFAEFERAMVRERTRAGLTAARAQGRTGGRRPKLLAQQRTEILGMLAAGRTGADVARIFRAHRATISRIAAAARAMVADPMPAPRGSALTEPALLRTHERPGRRAQPKS